MRSHDPLPGQGWEHRLSEKWGRDERQQGGVCVPAVLTVELGGEGRVWVAGGDRKPVLGG